MKTNALVYGALIALFLALPFALFAQTAEELQQQISEHNAQINALNEEIAAYEKQLADVGEKKQTLQNTLAQLDIQRKKLAASIKVTENKIGTLQLQIQVLSRNIAGKEESIATDQAGLSQSLRQLDATESKTIVEAMLSSENLSRLWSDIDQSQTIQDAVQHNIKNLSAEKMSLTEARTVTEEKRKELVTQQNALLAQQGSLDATRKAQAELLAQTKAQESTFQEILRQKQAAKASMEAALADLKAKFQVAIDPSLIPPSGKGILRWPLDSIKITQYFGDTPFARSGAYNGKGHNGVDFRATTGTPVKAALTGTVIGTGNTDAVRGCYSYGKWIMIRHNNGLSTLYAHLTESIVTTGQSVSTGEVIGYSGSTGYATGPHLHFGVYASSAVQIVRLGEATNRRTSCSDAVMPVAPLSGYLNPMDYL